MAVISTNTVDYLTASDPDPTPDGSMRRLPPPSGGDGLIAESEVFSIEIFSPELVLEATIDAGLSKSLAAKDFRTKANECFNAYGKAAPAKPGADLCDIELHICLPGGTPTIWKGKARLRT